MASHLEQHFITAAVKPGHHNCDQFLAWRRRTSAKAEVLMRRGAVGVNDDTRLGRLALVGARKVAYFESL